MAHRNDPVRQLALGFAIALAVTVAGCGGSSGGGGTTDPGPDPNPSCEADQQFSSTFEGIQKVIFEKHGCTEQICHGSSAQGGLNLSPDVAYENIYDKKSSTALKLIEPGDNDRSYLWLKLAASTNPGSVQISGSPMPNGLPALSADELELLRLWIYAGAPREGTVNGTQGLLNACLPDPEPIVIKPLDPPAPADGVQFVMPQWPLEKKSEHELCFATYYDFTDEVPEAYKDPSGELFRFSGFELRQDPQSHHLLLYYSPLNFQPGGIDTSDPSFGAWTCSGGPQDGQACDPKEAENACGGEGLCHSEFQKSFACVGYGPQSGAPAQIMGGAGQAQAYLPFFPGVFAQIPLKGVIYWNSHAFNTTTEDTTMHGRLNYWFAKNQTYPVVQINDFGAIFRPNNAPYTKETFCNDHVFPIGSRVFHLFAHMHKHGEHFWATLPDGTQIYETSSFSDPTQQRYDPPLAFDSPDPAERTVRYCGTYNNGIKADGSPDTELVTRLSRIPASAKGQIGGTCKPVACTAGKVGAACNGADDDASCDSSAGAGDGECDACPITGGESTQNEMFVLFGAQYIDPTVPGANPPEAPQDVAGVASHDESGRSLSTVPAFPHFQGCIAPGLGMTGTAGTSAGVQQVASSPH
ncbi:hypothetical protein K2Z84_19075 [Candidatus Binatia bacterium]|nr:hypothetical protein [Candidatus Binatia bacterium]